MSIFNVFFLDRGPGNELLSARIPDQPEWISDHSLFAKKSCCSHAVALVQVNAASMLPTNVLTDMYCSGKFRSMGQHYVRLRQRFAGLVSPRVVVDAPLRPIRADLVPLEAVKSFCISLTTQFSQVFDKLQQGDADDICPQSGVKQMINNWACLMQICDVGKDGTIYWKANQA